MFLDGILTSTMDNSKVIIHTFFAKSILYLQFEGNNTNNNFWKSKCGNGQVWYGACGRGQDCGNGYGKNIGSIETQFDGINWALL